MKEILAVVGSPRRGGNTDILVDAAIAGARTAGAVAEKVFLADLNIAPCCGCGNCRSRTPGKCCREDDMQELYGKILASDGMIIGTPVYWWGPSAQLKTFIDRWYAFLGNKTAGLAGKKIVLICAMGDDDPGTARHISGMFEDIMSYLKMESAGQLIVTASAKGEAAENAAALAEAKGLGLHLAAV